MGGNYTVGGSEVVDHVPLEDGVEVVRNVTFPGSTVQKATDGNAPTFQTDFTALSSLPTGILFARASNATMFDNTGTLTYAPNNIITSSNDFADTGVWFRGTTTVSGNTATFASDSVLQAFLPSASIAGKKVIVSIVASVPSGTGNYAFGFYDGAASGITTVALTTTPTRYTLVGTPSASSADIRFVMGPPYGGDASIIVNLASARFSTVTYETGFRSQDDVETTSTAYYGPRFDHNPATLAARGLLIEEARTNLFLTSQTPANQTITISNATVYTVSFYGTGSLTLTGAVAHTVTGSSTTVLTSYTFTSGTTSLVVAVAGSVLYPNVEAGAFATSHIPTTGGTATPRSADIALLTGTATTALEGSAASAILEVQLFATTPAGTEVLFGKSPTAYSLVKTATTLSFFSGGADLTATFGSGNISSAFRTAISFDGSTRNIVINGGTLVSGATVAAVTGDVPLGGYASGAQIATGWYAKMAIWNNRLIDATLTDKSVPGVAF